MFVLDVVVNILYCIKIEEFVENNVKVCTTFCKWHISYKQTYANRFFSSSEECVSNYPCRNTRGKIGQTAPKVLNMEMKWFATSHQTHRIPKQLLGFSHSPIDIWLSYAAAANIALKLTTDLPGPVAIIEVVPVMNHYLYLSTV